MPDLTRLSFDHEIATRLVTKIESSDSTYQLNFNLKRKESNIQCRGSFSFFFYFSSWFSCKSMRFLRQPVAFVFVSGGVEVGLRAKFESKFELANFTDWTLFAWAQLLPKFQIVACIRMNIL